MLTLDNLLFYFWFGNLLTSVADPDSDPIRSGLFRSPGSRSGKIPDHVSKKDPCNSKFLIIWNCVKYSFVKIIFSSLILSVIRWLDLVSNYYNKIIYFAKHQKHIVVGSGSGSGRIQSFWGHQDPDPDFYNRICRSESLKKWTGFVRNTAINTDDLIPAVCEARFFC